MKKKCMIKALIVLAFALILWTAGYTGKPGTAYGETLEENISQDYEGDTEAAITLISAEQPKIRDLSDAFRVILQGATKEFIAGYMVDDAFLMWLDAVYGHDKVITIAQSVLEGDLDTDRWYEVTGDSIHVLWLRYCQDTGFQNYRLENVYWKKCADTNQTVISFAGDFNFAEDWYTMQYVKTQSGNVKDCFSKELLAIMNESDILLMNNEFTYTNSNTPLAGKDYTFQARPQMAEMLKIFGTDIVSLANNHVFDYGEVGLQDTIANLRRNQIPYVGAGTDLQEASGAVYFVANGRKIAIVSATEVERTQKYTREATESLSGVLKTQTIKNVTAAIAQAKKNSDYVIVVAHWGTEGVLYVDAKQKTLSESFVGAGADAIIGGHPHRLQGAGFVQGIPVAYSLGNFWFSNGTLFTTLAQIVISADGDLQLKYLPCIQKNLTTSLITDTTEKDEFYHYLASISENIGIDREGNVYDKSALGDFDGQIVYDSDTSTTGVSGHMDNEGRIIDIVGNLIE